jgi:uncharacterized protein (DUF4415 family)
MIEAVRNRPDEAIDTSDMPEVTDWSGAVRGALYRPVKKPTTIRLDADVLAWFKAHGGERGYQTRINRALREYIRRHETEAAGD